MNLLLLIFFSYSQIPDALTFHNKSINSIISKELTNADSVYFVLCQYSIGKDIYITSFYNDSVSLKHIVTRNLKSEFDIVDCKISYEDFDDLYSKIVDIKTYCSNEKYFSNSKSTHQKYYLFLNDIKLCEGDIGGLINPFFGVFIEKVVNHGCISPDSPRGMR